MMLPTYVVFADKPRRVATLCEDGSDVHVVVFQRDVKAGRGLRALGEQLSELVAVGRAGTSAGQERVSGRRADRAGDKGVVETHTLSRQPV